MQTLKFYKKKKNADLKILKKKKKLGTKYHVNFKLVKKHYPLTHCFPYFFQILKIV